MFQSHGICPWPIKDDFVLRADMYLLEQISQCRLTKLTNLGAYICNVPIKWHLPLGSTRPLCSCEQAHERTSLVIWMTKLKVRMLSSGPEQWAMGAAALFMLGEWWACEIVVLLAGKLPNAAQSLSAMNIFMETNALSFMLPLGLSIGIAIRYVSA